jgi:hypothetical protein
MPAVTEFSKPNGDPIAATASPTRSWGGIAQLDGRQVVGGDLDDGNIGTAVGANHLGAECALVDELDRHFVCATHHMGIGQDVAVVADDEAGAGAARGNFLDRPASGTARRKKAAEEFLHVFPIGNHERKSFHTALHQLGGADVDHCRAVFFDQFGNIHRLSCHCRRRQGHCQCCCSQRRSHHDHPFFR